ncbi:hypothetical protein [Acetivibrio straminisolvens]|uniref:Nitrite reductase n=1 Tax=Acetivibrio straminisolvens JCM 21531 TaxID=1294263 RepID=W4V2S6_9FIRM|nr:nitrite reductase [Acetivibrio straminisolvens JCM 21531]
MKYVIIGNSTAAVGAVEGIRKIDMEGEITIISKELTMYIQDLLYRICCMVRPMRKE